MNGTIIIFRAGKITLAEKVSSGCPTGWPDLATGSYASYSLRHRGMSFFRCVELTYVGLFLQAWSCLFALRLHVQAWTLRLSRACYCSWCHSSWPPAICWNNQASGVVGLGGRGRQPGSTRMQSWLVSLDTAIRLLEAGQACLQGTSCCCSQILSKFGCSVSLGPLLTVPLDQVAVLALCVQLVALHAAVVFPL